MFTLFSNFTSFFCVQ